MLSIYRLFSKFLLCVLQFKVYTAIQAIHCDVRTKIPVALDVLAADRC